MVGNILLYENTEASTVGKLHFARKNSAQATNQILSLV